MWAMNNKWQVMYKVMESPVYKGKIGKNDNSKKEGHWLWKMVRDKSDAQKCVFRPRIAIYARISDIHLDCLSGQKKILV